MHPSYMNHTQLEKNAFQMGFDDRLEEWGMHTAPAFSEQRFTDAWLRGWKQANIDLKLQAATC